MDSATLAKPARAALLELTQGAVTLGDLLRQRARETADPIRFVSDVSRGFVARAEASTLSPRSEQYEAACRAASLLARAGAGPGEHVILLLPNPRDFIAFYFGCQLLGAVAVPLVPPWSVTRMDGHVQRILRVASICRPAATVLVPQARAAVAAFGSREAGAARLGRLIDPRQAAESAADDPNVRRSSDDVAMVQFTSGSTAAPRGVELTHRALLENCASIGSTLGFDEPGHLGCSWLPLFHDMGLIGHILTPLLFRIPTILLPPESFMQRPASWLEAIAGWGATISTAPNFAYHLCGTRLSDRHLTGLDLSRWQVALCGGEPVLTDTVRAFTEKLAPYGFRPQAFCPVYGLAEASLAVTLSERGAGPITDRIDRNVFAREGRAVPAGDVREELALVSSGRPPPDFDVDIRSDALESCPDGTEGMIWIRGPSLMKGYLHDPESTAQSLRDGWLWTGDRGYLKDRQLFVTGRSKEVIIKGGRNLHPQEFERLAACVEGIRPGRVAAIGVLDETEGTDRFVLLCETKESNDDARLRIERAVLSQVTENAGVRPDEVVLLEPGTLSKTSSGKMQRGLAKRRYLEGDLHRPTTGPVAKGRYLLERVRLVLRPSRFERLQDLPKEGEDGPL